MLGNELQNAVEKAYGKGTDLRVVHPLKTYKQGRSTGISVGIAMGASMGIGHELFQHGAEHMGWWMLGFMVFIGGWIFYIGHHSEPNKIATDVRKSIDIYRDEK